ncbi:hypothetical protein CRYUN_Cryun29cG0001500 [Craigia yunnanensis]
MEEAEKLFVEMKGNNLVPTVISYTTMIKGQNAEAKTILTEMVQRYISPKDNSIFIKLLNSQCKSGDLNAAADVLKEMIRLSIPTEAGHYGVLIENFCNAIEFDRAITLLDTLVEKEIVLRP